MKSHKASSFPRRVMEADNDITVERVPIGRPRGWALVGLFFSVLGVLLFLYGLSSESKGIGEAWTMFGLVVLGLGFFTLLIALFWHENLRKYREERAQKG